MKVIIENDEGQRTMVPFVGEALNIGRDENNHVRLTEKNVSRKHCRLLRQDGKYLIEDLQSFTGIRVNGEKVRGKRQVREGDLIQISEYDLMLQYGPDEAPKDQPGDEEPTPTDPMRAGFKSGPGPGLGKGGPHGSTAGPAPGAPAGSSAGMGTGHDATGGAPALAQGTGAGSPASSASAEASGGPGGILLVAALVVAVLLGLFLARGRGEGDGGGASRSSRQVRLERAEGLAAAHRYREALKELTEAQAAGVSPDEIRDLKRVELESAAEEQYEGMQQAIRSGDWDRARLLFEIASASPTWYGTRTRESASTVTAGYAQAHLGRARAAQATDKKACLAEAQLTLSFDPQNEEARALAAACGTTAAAPRATARGSTYAEVTPPAAAPADPDTEARRLLQQANLKGTSKDLDGAVHDLEAAVELHPSPPVLGGLYRSLGQLWQRRGDSEKSVHFYKLYLPLCDNPTEKVFLQKSVDDYEAGHPAH